MKLYYSPGACSLASHIVLEEIGQNATYEKVDLKSKKTESGEDFKKINPKGYVPALQLDNGEVLTENLALLPYLAEVSGKLMPKEQMRKFRTLEACAFISTEIHKGFKPLFDPTASDEAKQKAKDFLAQRFELQAGWLDKEFVMGDELTVADAYLLVMTLWATKMDVKLPKRIEEFRDRMKQRPAVQRALKAEGLA